MRRSFVRRIHAGCWCHAPVLEGSGFSWVRRVAFREMTALVIVALLIGGIASSAGAQGTTSRLVGVITDTTGAVVPGATISLTNEATGVSFTTASTAAGTYVFEAVQVGRYSVTVELQGFRKFVSRGNDVTIGQPTTVNATLSPGDVAETVQVTAASETVQLGTSGNFGTIIQQKVLESLPIVGVRGRNPLTLVSTLPGVVVGSNTGGGVHVHGARDRSWNFTLDGIDINESSAGGSNFSPLRTNPDSIAEFRVLTGNFTAEFGRNSGGQVAMITRSGTNEFHGTGFYFHRRPEFNANEWENNLNGLPKREFFQHISGFSLGGPIRRNRTFFFVNSQVLRARQTGSFTRLVYTDSARRGIWRYVQGGRNQPAGAPGASVDTSGNVLSGLSIGTYNVPANDPQRLGLDPTTQRLIGATPLPNNFTTGDGLNTAGFTFSALETEEQLDMVAKVDHVLSDRHHVFGRVAWGGQDTLCDQVNGGEPRFPGLPCVVNTERSPANVAVNWRWSSTSSLVNELVVGGNHFTFNFVIPTGDPSRPTFDFSGIPALDPRRITIPEAFEFGNLRTINLYQLVENLNYMRGAHSLRVGANIRYQQHQDIRGSVAGGNVHPTINFSTTVNTVDPIAFNLPTDINTAFDRPALQSHINFLLGRVGSISQGFVAQGDRYGPGGTKFNFDARYPELDFYAQDNWKLRRNLTVDAGVRWELKLAPRNPQDLIKRPNQRVAVGERPSNTLRWEEGPLHDDDVNNVGPSVGVAWDPQGEGKSAVRANYRLAFDRLNTFVLSSSIFQSIPGITAGVVNTDFGQAGGRLRQTLPSLSPTVTPSDFLQPPPTSSSSIRVVDPEFGSPRTHGWAVSYQRELWNRTVFEATYVGRRAEHLYGAYNVNQARYRDDGFLEAFNTVRAGGQSDLMNRLLIPDTRRLASETGSDMVRRLFEDTLTLNGVASLASAIGTRIQGGRSIPELAGFGPFFFFPYPQFLGGVIVIDSNDYSRYHALELKLDRRFADNFGVVVGYTLSKSKDTRSYDPAFTVVSTGAAQSASSTPFDIFNRDLNFALSDFDRRHVLQGNLVAELPFGRGKRFATDAGGVLDRLVGGWQVSMTMTLQSGRPFTVYGGANTLSNVVQTPANCNGCSQNDGRVFDDQALTPVVKWYFDGQARGRFSTPGPGEFSNVGRNFFIGPGSFSMNLAVLKSVRLKEGHRLEYRLEATNVTNTPTFGFPTATITSTVFGRIRDNVISGSRKIQMGVKYYF